MKISNQSPKKRMAIFLLIITFALLSILIVSSENTTLGDSPNNEDKIQTNAVVEKQTETPATINEEYEYIEIEKLNEGNENLENTKNAEIMQEPANTENSESFIEPAKEETEKPIISNESETEEPLEISEKQVPEKSNITQDLQENAEQATEKVIKNIEPTNEQLNNEPAIEEISEPAVDTEEDVKAIEENTEENTVLIDIDKIIPEENTVDYAGEKPKSETEEPVKESEKTSQNPVSNQTMESNETRESLNESLNAVTENVKFELTSEKNRKIGLAGEVPEDTDISKIEKKEIVENNLKKQVIVSSQEHIDFPLTIYTDIMEISKNQKENVKIYWINENSQEIGVKEFIDDDNDGLYERVSWVVPHLSEQIFEVVIDFSTNNNSGDIEIGVNNPLPNQVDNPILFDFSINYTKLENLNCSLSVGSNIISLDVNDQTISQEYNLPNGDYNWSLNCTDLNNSGISKVESGVFSVNEEFSVSTPREVYVLYENDLVKGGSEVTITSQKNTNISIEVEKPSGKYKSNYSGTSYALNLNESILTEKGNYLLNVTFDRLSQPVSIIKDFSVAQASISFDNTEVKTDEEVKITINVDSPVKKITSLIIEFGDGESNVDYYNLNENSKNVDFYHPYEDSGDYIVKLSLSFEGISGKYEVQKNGISVENVNDNEKPTVTLLDPSDEKETKENRITFSYRAKDNVKIENCTFQLYNYSKGWEELDYETTKTDIENDEVVEIKLQDFKEGDYSWYVFCCDNSSNCNNDFDYERDLTILDPDSDTISLASGNSENSEFEHEKTDEIKSLTLDIENFLNKKESYSLEEKQVLEDLGISSNLEFYKKRLVQLDQDLGNNLGFISDETIRRERKQEIYDEIEDIKNNIPKDITLVGEKEYVKNSITNTMEDIVKDYVDAENIKLDKGGIKKLADLNYKIQNYMTVLTDVKHVEITYSRRIDSITLVSKKIDLKNNSVGKILEVIPKEISSNASEITFITENRVVKEDPIFEISLDNLEDDRVVYYIPGMIDLQEIEKIETVLFKEFSLEGVGITGLSVLSFGEINFSFYYLLLIIILILFIYLILSLIKRVRIYKWKKEENVVRIFKLIRKSKLMIKRNDINTAKEKYHQIRELYPLIPKGCKKYTSKDIKKIRVSIDKKEIFGLAKEYDEMKKQGRNEDALMIYKDIQLIYKRLPKKYQRIIYNKMFNPSKPTNK